MLYKTAGNLRACQLLLGRRKLESTVRYLGIEVDDALELSQQVGLWTTAASLDRMDAEDVGAGWDVEVGCK